MSKLKHDARGKMSTKELKREDIRIESAASLRDPILEMDDKYLTTWLEKNVSTPKEIHKYLHRLTKLIRAVAKR